MALADSSDHKASGTKGFMRASVVVLGPQASLSSTLLQLFPTPLTRLPLVLAYSFSLCLPGPFLRRSQDEQFVHKESEKELEEESNTMAVKHCVVVFYAHFN